MCHISADTEGLPRDNSQINLLNSQSQPEEEHSIVLDDSSEVAPTIDPPDQSDKNPDRYQSDKNPGSYQSGEYGKHDQNPAGNQGDNVGGSQVEFWPQPELDDRGIPDLGCTGWAFSFCRDENCDLCPRVRKARRPKPGCHNADHECRHWHPETKDCGMRFFFVTE